MGNNVSFRAKNEQKTCCSLLGVKPKGLLGNCQTLSMLKAALIVCKYIVRSQSSDCCCLYSSTFPPNWRFYPPLQDSVVKGTKQSEAHLVGQQRQLMNRGVQVERNMARLEEDVMRLKQIGEMNNKKFQAMSDRMNDILQQVANHNNAIDVGIQDLRQMNHSTELGINKNVSPLFHIKCWRNVYPSSTCTLPLRVPFL